MSGVTYIVDQLEYCIRCDPIDTFCRYEKCYGRQSSKEEWESSLETRVYGSTTWTPGCLRVHRQWSFEISKVVSSANAVRVERHTCPGRPNLVFDSDHGIVSMTSLQET